MASFFSKPFDEATLYKLALWKDYLNAALPVFIENAKRPFGKKKIRIFDFFCGPGQDVNGVHGSPLIALNLVNNYMKPIEEFAIQVELVFNDIENKSVQTLVDLLKDNPKHSNRITTKVYNKPFIELFEDYLPEMKNSFNLVFIDQYGIKEVTDEVFLKLTSLPKTDFMFFISSSFLYRFKNQPEMTRHFPTISEELSGTRFYHVHREMAEHYQSLHPDFFVSKFSIKKGFNLYGLIFGSGHPLGLEKFLKIAWKMDKERGEANFDIDHDKIHQNTPFLFGELDRPKKINQFENQLGELLKQKKLQTDKDLYYFALRSGFTQSHIQQALKNLKIKFAYKQIKPYQKGFIPTTIYQ